MELCLAPLLTLALLGPLSQLTWAFYVAQGGSLGQLGRVEVGALASHPDSAVAYVNQPQATGGRVVSRLIPVLLGKSESGGRERIFININDPSPRHDPPTTTAAPATTCPQGCFCGADGSIGCYG